jgi:hypothetical protein
MPVLQYYYCRQSCFYFRQGTSMCGTRTSVLLPVGVLVLARSSITSAHHHVIFEISGSY